MESGFKLSSTSSHSAQQTVNKTSGPEKRTTLLLLSKNGSFKNIAPSQVKSVLSTLDSKQQVIIEQHAPLPHRQIEQITVDHQPTDSKKSGVGNMKRTPPNVKILKEKKCAESTEELGDWRDEKNIKWIELKSNSLEEETPVSASDNDVEVIFIEDASVPIATHEMHTYSKYSKVNHPDQEDGDKNENSGSNLKENKQKSPLRRKKKSGSLDRSSTSHIEQVACYKCKFCMFLSLSQDAVTIHAEQEHATDILTESNCSMQCPGCSNIFFSHKSLRIHLSEDHNVAQEELENILSTFKAGNSGENETESDLNSISNKGEQLVPPNSVSEIEIVEESIASAGRINQSCNIDKAAETRRSKPTGSVKKGAKLLLHKKFVGKGIIQENLAPSDETGKIRVRKLSTLEKSQQEINADVLVKNDVLRIESNDTIVTEENSSTLPTHIHLEDVEQEEDMPMDIQYDIESMEILDIPLDQQPNEPHEQLEGELSQPNPECETILHSIEEHNGHRYCTISTSEACGDIIDDICPEEVLDNVLYVEDGEIIGDQNSPIVVCFAASPNDISGHGDDYDIQIEDNISTGSGCQNIDNCPERIVLSSCTFYDGTDVVGSDGKKLVKRGFAKRPTSKKNRSKKPKILKSKHINNDKEEPTIAGYKCNTYGCTVRLLSHDNMEYHQRCHVPNNFSENDLKDTSGENENLPASKKRRILLNKHTFDCPECSIGLHTWKQMKNHLWKSHSIDMELYSCNQCGYKTPSLSNMKNIHVKIHGSERPFLCDSCGKGFKTTKQLRNHKVIHVRKEATVQTCETCGRTFHSNRLLRSHINTVHNKVRPYMCSECGHTAANRSSLKMHLRQHTGDRPYECDQCEYTTADHNSLRRHKKRHTGDKPYKCPICSYACIQSSTYKTHLRSKHPGQDLGLMFSCKKCAFHSVNHDIYLAHTAEHDVAESCGVPFKSAPRTSRRRNAKQVKISDESSCEEIPIYVSIATNDATNESEQPNFENIVQHVSEEILPGSNLHVLYNSISLTDSNIKETDSSSASNNVLQNPIIQIVDDESNFELVAEVDNPESVIEVPAEEYKLRDTKVRI